MFRLRVPERDREGAREVRTSPVVLQEMARAAVPVSPEEPGETEVRSA